MLPTTWPCQWNQGNIPFAFDFFALSPKRLISVVHRAHSYITERSCLVFKEVNPADAAAEEDFIYLFYTYSEVLENCCLKLYTKTGGRRLVLITPTCFLQVEVAHATLHALGLEHPREESFSETQARAVMFPYKCRNIDEKMAQLNDNT